MNMVWDKSINCTEACIPITYSILFNTSNIKVCQSFEDHFCADWDIWFYIVDQFKTCYKRSPEKYFKGVKYYDDGFYNYASSVINKDRENRTLFELYWYYQSNLTTIITNYNIITFNSVINHDNFMVRDNAQ